MECIGLKLTPVVVRHLLGHLGMFGPMASVSWTHTVASPNGPNVGYSPNPASHPPLMLAPPPSHPPTSHKMPLVILQVLWKSCSNPSSVCYIARRNSYETLAKTVPDIQYIWCGYNLAQWKYSGFNICNWYSFLEIPNVPDSEVRFPKSGHIQIIMPSVVAWLTLTHLNSIKYLYTYVLR